MAGLLLGGGAGAALSRGDGRWWAIPLGAVVGSHIGCDLAAVSYTHLTLPTKRIV